MNQTIEFDPTVMKQIEDELSDGFDETMKKMKTGEFLKEGYQSLSFAAPHYDFSMVLSHVGIKMQIEQFDVVRMRPEKLPQYEVPVQDGAD